MDEIVNSNEKAEIKEPIEVEFSVISSGIMNSGITAPGAVDLDDKREVAYVMKDPVFGKFEVGKSDNAWWMERAKLELLVNAFKSGHIIKSAIIYAGISKDQWQYFIENHPDFYRVKEACEEVQMFKAMNTINANLEDIPTARWFMDRRHSKFAAKVRVETDAPLQPTINQNLNVGNVININSGEIAGALKEIAREVFGADEESARAITDEIMENKSQEEPKQMD